MMVVILSQKAAQLAPVLFCLDFASTAEGCWQFIVYHRHSVRKLDNASV